MVANIIGNYLVEKGIISASVFQNVLEMQNSARVKMGLLAVAEGMMSIEQADEVNRLQAVMDQRFGDIAVAKGFLTEEQIGTLLKKQGNAYLTFVQTLVDANVMTMDQIDQMEKDFAAYYQYSAEQVAAIKSDEPDQIVPIFLPTEAKKYDKAVSTILKTIIRQIDRNAYLKNASMVDSFPENKQVNQSMDGENAMVDGFQEGNGGLLQVAALFCKDEFESLDADALDSAGELLNCANGLYVSGLSRQGNFLELMPPNYGAVEASVKSGTICSVPLYLGEQYLNYVVAEC